MTRPDLAGIGVLLTRPRHQAGELATAIDRAGGSVVAFPVIEIVARAAEAISREARALADPDIVIFVSSNAVTHGLAYAAAKGAAVAAVGPATRDTLRSAGISVDIIPRKRFDSEHLLAEPALQDVAGKSIRIVRGNDGRELLAETLRQRGAVVDYLSVYERRAVQHDAEQLAELNAAWDRGSINRCVVMSVDSLFKLLAALPDSCICRLRQTPLVTPSARVIQTATELLPDAPLKLAAGPRSEDILQALAATADISMSQT